LTLAIALIWLGACATVEPPARPGQPVAAPTSPEKPWLERMFGSDAASGAWSATPVPDGKVAPAQPPATPAPSAPPAPGAPVPAAVPAKAPPAGLLAGPAATPGKASAPTPPATDSSPKEETARLFPGTGVFVRPPPIAPVLPQSEEVSLNFENQDVKSVVSFVLKDLLRETYTIHPSVAGTITLTTARPVPRTSLIAILETVLRQNGHALVREDSVWKVVPIALAVRGTTTPQLLPPGAQLKPGYSVILLPLKFAGVKEMQRILTPFAIDPTAVQADELRNMLVLSGTQRELKHLLDTVEMFDVDWLQGMSVGIYSLRSADVKALQPELNQLFGATGPLAGAVRLVPLERLNGFLMITTQPRYLERAKEWLQKLDSLSGTTGGQRLFVYQVQNGKAENLASLLGEIFGKGAGTAAAPQVAPGLRPAQLQSGPTATPVPGAAPAPAPTAPAGATTAAIQGGIGVSKDVRVIADKDNNALLILATSGDYEVIESALKKLDVVQRQVLIEVTIAEVKLDNALKYGVDWYFSNLNRDGISASGLSSGRIASSGAISTEGAVNFTSLYGGLSLIRNVAGGLRAVIQAVDNGSNVKLLSSPQITVADNKQASFSVGASISVNTGQTTGSGSTTTSSQYISTGTIVNITPRVNAGGMVSLDIDLEVSVPGQAAANGNPPIDQRRLKTTVAVSSGESIIVAGLIRDDVQRSNVGLPLLSRLPFVGGAFGTQTFNTTRTELLFSITPKLISSIEQNRQMVDELRLRFREVGPSIPKPAPTSPEPAKEYPLERLFKSLDLGQKKP
jgi:general secretion pathway protein D